MMQSADVAHQYEKARDLVKRVIEKYRTAYSALWENYTLVLLLVMRESGVWISPDALKLAAEGELPNLTSIHRALTDVKKDYQTSEQKETSERLENEWRRVFIHSEGKVQQTGIEPYQEDD